MADPTRKTFSALASETQDPEQLQPIPFTLDGRLRHPVPKGKVPAEVARELERWDRVTPARRAELEAEYDLEKTWSIDFEALPVVPSGVLDDLMRSVGQDDSGKQVWNSVSLNRFMCGVLYDEYVEPYLELVRDKNRLVPIETLGDVMLWLAGEVTDTPS